MADLSVNYCGVEFKNPLILASGSPGWDGESMRQAGLAGIGGMVQKTIASTTSWVGHPRNGRMVVHKHKGQPLGLINLELFSTLSREEWFNTDFALAKQGGARLQASILAMPDPAETAELVTLIEKTGYADLFEINASCPMPADTVGMHISKDAQLTYNHVKAAKSVATLPVTVKLTPNVTDMVEVAAAAKEAGADGISIANTVRALAGVDIDTGRLRLASYGGYSGPAIRPITMRHLAEVASAVDIPISAVGGVSSFRDVVEYTMLGATTVQLCTGVMWEGYGLISKILADLEQWMNENGHKNLAELRGVALSQLTTVEELSELPALRAAINTEACIACGKCKTVCMYRAVNPGEKAYSINPARCDGCGLCAQFCPKKCIALA